MLDKRTYQTSAFQASGPGLVRCQQQLALLLACGLRRHEAVALRLDHLQQREEHWAIVDLVGKGGHVRTVQFLIG
jgi:site-specific recombinase XerD